MGARGGAGQTDVDLAPLVSRFGSEEKCRSHLEELRWPNGVQCPRCGTARGISRLESRSQFDCNACGYQFSVRVGTVFHDSHLPLWKWFLAVYVISESKNGVSGNQLKDMLGISYKTAWYLSHRIRSAMSEGPLPTNLDESAGHHLFRDMLLRLLEPHSIREKELIA